MESTRRVIVTGSTGNLGAKAIAALKRLDGIELVRIGRNRANDADVINAELDKFNAGWARVFQSADVVLHLAADPKPVSSWESITRLNIDLALNVFRAAEEGGVRRFIFASSNWVLGGYRFGKEKLTATLAPKPVNAYGASKLFLERYGLAVAARTGMAVLILRIGYCQPGENQPGPHMAFGRWGQQMWLSNKDWEQAVCKAVAIPFEGAAIINVVSRNANMRWDIDDARRLLGYEPVEGHQPVMNITATIKDLSAQLRDYFVPRGSSSPLFGARW
jgi:NAD+ dependent glucose-6-phosphate dehydrogenase